MWANTKHSFLLGYSHSCKTHTRVSLSSNFSTIPQVLSQISNERGAPETIYAEADSFSVSVLPSTSLASEERQRIFELRLQRLVIPLICRPLIVNNTFLVA